MSEDGNYSVLIDGSDSHPQQSEGSTPIVTLSLLGATLLFSIILAGVSGGAQHEALLPFSNAGGFTIATSVFSILAAVYGLYVVHSRYEQVHIRIFLVVGTVLTVFSLTSMALVAHNMAAVPKTFWCEIPNPTTTCSTPGLVNASLAFALFLLILWFSLLGLFGVRFTKG